MDVEVLYIVETPQDLDSFAEKCEISGNDLILVTNSVCSTFLKKRGVDHLCLDDLINRDSYYTAKKISEKKIFSLVSQLNQYGAKDDLELGNYFYFQLYVVLGSLHHKAFLINEALRGIEYKKIVVKAESHSELIHGFRNRIEGDFSKIVQQNYENVRGYSFSSKKSSETLKSKLQKFLHSERRYVFDTYTKLRNKKRRFFSFKRRKGLVLDPLYNWEFFLEKIEENFSITYFKGESLSEMVKGRPPVDFSELFQDCLSFEGVKLGCLFEKQIGVVWNTYKSMRTSLPRMLKEIEGFEFVAASITPFPWQNFILHCFQRKEKSVLYYQHGEMNLYNDSLFSETMETRYTSKYICFGKGVIPKYKGKVDQVIPAGSLTIQKLRKKIFKIEKKEKPLKTIVYVTGKYFHHASPFIDSFMPDKKLLDAQEKIINFLETLSKDDYRIVFRPSNTKYFNVVPCQISSHIETYSDGKFTDLLEKADILIFDSPATTVIEAAVTSVPMFVLMNRIEWFSRPKELLGKRAVISLTPERLISKVGNYLKNRQYDADVNDDFFLKNYALGESDSLKDVEDLFK